MSTNNYSQLFDGSNRSVFGFINGKSKNNNCHDNNFEPESPFDMIERQNQSSDLINNILQISLNEDSSDNEENFTHLYLYAQNKTINANSPEKTLPVKKKCEKSTKTENKKENLTDNKSKDENNNNKSINGDKKKETKEKQNISEETRNKLNEIVKSNENRLFDEINRLNETNKNITNEEINELNENQKKSKNDLDIEICNNIKSLFVIVLIKLILDSKNDIPIINMNDFVKKQFYEEKSIDIIKKYIPKKLFLEINDIYNNYEYQKPPEFLRLTPYLYFKKKLNELNKANNKIGNKQKNFKVNGNSILDLIIFLTTQLNKKEAIENKLIEKNKDKIDILNIKYNITNRIGEGDYLNDNLDTELYDFITNNNKINITNKMLDKKYSNTNCSTNNTFNSEEIEKKNREDNLREKIKREKKNNKKVFNKKDFDDFENKQSKSYKNQKCKNKAKNIFISLNLDGLILLTKLITIEKGQYIKIKNSKEFANAIKSCIGQDFSLDLTEKEKKNIEERVVLLKAMDKDSKLFLKKKRERNNSK